MNTGEKEIVRFPVALPDSISTKIQFSPATQDKPVQASVRSARLTVDRRDPGTLVAADLLVLFKVHPPSLRALEGRVPVMASKSFAAGYRHRFGRWDEGWLRYRLAFIVAWFPRVGLQSIHRPLSFRT